MGKEADTSDVHVTGNYQESPIVKQLNIEDYTKDDEHDYFKKVYKEGSVCRA